MAQHPRRQSSSERIGFDTCRIQFEIVYMPPLPSNTVSDYQVYQAPHHHHHHWLDSPTWALAFLRSFCLLKYPAIASDFVTSLFQVGVVSPTPKPRLSWRADVFCQECLP
jgi:hypothetical protein